MNTKRRAINGKRNMKRKKYEKKQEAIEQTRYFLLKLGCFAQEIFGFYCLYNGFEQGKISEALPFLGAGVVSLGSAKVVSRVIEKEFIWNKVYSRIKEEFSSVKERLDDLEDKVNN